MWWNEVDKMNCHFFLITVRMIVIHLGWWLQRLLICHTDHRICPYGLSYQNQRSTIGRDRPGVQSLTYSGLVKHIVCICELHGSSLLQVMAWHFSAKPLPGLMLTHCQSYDFDPRESSKGKFLFLYEKCQLLHLLKLAWMTLINSILGITDV